MELKVWDKGYGIRDIGHEMGCGIRIYAKCDVIWDLWYETWDIKFWIWYMG